MRASPLPASLPAAFTVHDAAMRGVPPQRLRATDLAAPFHGTRTTRPLTEPEQARLLLNALPAHAFACGPTAAAIHRLPLPSHVRRTAFGPLWIGVPTPANRIRRPRVRGRSVTIEPDEIVVVDGIRCTSPPRTWTDLSALLELPALVAVADRLLFHRDPLCTRHDLEHACARSAGRPGAIARRRSLDLCSDRAESARESELRVLLALAGLPAPDVNVEVFDGPRFVARVDLLFAAQRLIVEYDGDHHRDPVQWSRDQVRRAELESLGYRYTTVTARDFDDPARLTARIRRLLLPHDPPRHAA